MPWPGYGEYPHVIENLVGCPLRRFPLPRAAGYAIDLEALSSEISRGQDLVIIVNPNSPTGRHAPRAELVRLIERSLADTRFWIDETYVDYAGEGESLEGFAASSANTVVAKSMSKVYALSGIRAGYLCGPPHVARDLARRLRPWAVGLPGQIAAIEALRDPAYYGRRHAETRALREALARSMGSLGLEVVPGSANFVFADMPAAGPDAAELTRRCREDGLYIREWEGSVRIAVKDAATNVRIAAILERALKGG
jgi:histidinol-phosphate/aromatic aminotransferase/cobyric acid decarboxylase-like protein